MDFYQEFIFNRTYSRLKEDGTKESWDETVNRYRDFFYPRVPQSLLTDFEHAIELFRNMEVMPSMRAVWSAGKALERENLAAYNCAYTTFLKPKDFADYLYVLMCGTGAGFSVENKVIQRLPTVPKKINKSAELIIVEDSREGWAEAFHTLLNLLWLGKEPAIDYSFIRPRGTPLKTFGGRASGHEPLKQLFEFTIEKFKTACGRKLKSIEVYDIAVMTANCVVAGGIRRSATISLSDLNDIDMRDAKRGQFWVSHPYRTLSNNSVIITNKITREEFEIEWEQLKTSGTGERAIINRDALITTSPEDRELSGFAGVNPCGEVVLNPKETCNLTEIIIRSTDTLDILKDKARAATLLGTLQATLTNFNYISKEWKKNIEEERLLGVSLTGLKDHPILNHVCKESKDILTELYATISIRNKIYAKALNINEAKALTSVKPSGTVSQLVGVSSGLHARWSKYYIRRVRLAATDPLVEILRNENIILKPEVADDPINPTTWVAEFYVKAPDSCITRNEETAIDQLEYWKMLKEYYTDHNPSISVYVKEHEWEEVKNWVWENRFIVSGISFFPANDAKYELAPYEEISKEIYLTEISNTTQNSLNGAFMLYTEEETESGCLGNSCSL